MFLVMSDVHATLLWVALGVIVAACGTTGAIYTTIIKPTRREHEKREADAAKQSRANDILLNGTDGIPGLAPTVIPLALRMQSLETVVGSAVSGLGENTAEVKRMAEWQKDANGTARRTERAIQEIAAQVRGIALAGAVTKSDLHDAASAVAGIATHRQQIILEAIATGEVHLPDQPLKT